MYEVNILVNGNRCKQYSHEGKLYIEAKRGSEYSIEIKNNSCRRILAIGSVDSLNIITGKTATEVGPGYVIPPYNSSKLDGFRISDNEVAKFVFDYKNSSYASSKKDGSERNVGVVGVKLFAEKVKEPIKEVIIEHHDHYYPSNPWKMPPWNCPPIIWGSTTDCVKYGNHMYTRTASYSCNTPTTMEQYSCDTLNCAVPACADMKADNDWMTKDCERSSEMPDGALGERLTRGITSFADARPRKAKAAFDMGTKWGGKKESKVIDVEFERGLIIEEFNIYYASRESLIEMGVPIGNEKQINFPEAFPNKYAKPPEGWVGE